MTVLNVRVDTRSEFQEIFFETFEHKFRVPGTLVLRVSVRFGCGWIFHRSRVLFPCEFLELT